jgi:ubiquinone/menaquinone biosynthesis C-methylase UbiE
MIKNIEKNRYEKRFRALHDDKTFRKAFGSSYLNPTYREPYIVFEKIIMESITKDHTVLEIGSGDGAYTYCLLKTGAIITATDIAPSSLRIIRNQFQDQFPHSLKTHIADMIKLPFKDSSYDVVVSAGSLSYGENKLVLKEMKRVLKKDGFLILVDSLNHNIIYRFNRFIQFLIGKRSWMTIKNMPDKNTVSLIQNIFRDVKVSFFGSITWISPLITPIIGYKRVSKIICDFDRKLNVKYSAFKIVIKAKK